MRWLGLVERIDGAVVLAAAATCGVLAVVHPWPVFAFACAAGAVVAVRRPPRPSLAVIVAASLLAVFAGVRAAGALRADAEAAAITARDVPRPDRCVVEGTVVSMPVFRGALAADVAGTVRCEQRELPAARVRLHDLPEDSARGDAVIAVAQIAPSRRLLNPDLGDARPMFARRAHVLSGGALTVERVASGRGVAAWLDRVRARLRRGIAATFPLDLQPIARAIVLGEEDLLDADDEAFRRSGLTHLLAVSGSHVALAVGSMVTLLRFALLRVTRLARRVEVGRLAALLGVPLACAYEQLAGDSGSARRATVMAVVLLIVRAAARTPDLARTLGVSVLVVLALDPLAPFDLSFVLSIAATVGLVALGPFVDRPLARVRAMPRMLRSALSATVAASIACAPLVAGLSGTLPVLGVVANVVAVPIGELMTLPLCNAAALAGAIGVAPLARIVGDAASGSVVLLRGVARIAAAPEHAVLSARPPTAWQLVVLAAMCAAIYLLRRRALALAPLALAAVLLLEVRHVRASRPRGLLRVTVLDVAQGDATLVDLPDGSAMLIDAGGEVGSSWDPGRAVVAPVLAARRRAHLEVAVLSHPHPDHFLGLPRALERARVSSFWHNGQLHGDSPLSALVQLLAAHGARVETPSSLCGARTIGGARIEILHPCPRADPDHGANDNSLVVRVSFGRRSVLLVGDAEREAEDALLARGSALRADLLKVGHHGSRTSSSAAFLAAVSPSVATISCGARNRFGHPHPVALAALSDAGARVLRTDVDGAIRWTTDGEHVTVAVAREGW